MAAGTEGSERRGSWRQFFSKLKAAFRRRTSINLSISRKSPSQEPHSVMTEPQAPLPVVDIVPADPLDSLDGVADLQPACVSPAFDLTSLVVDDTIEANNDPAESPLPMLSTHTGLSNERAQRLFEKYGIKYEPRVTSNQPDTIHGVRRVEKPIRVRIHWTCEECNTNFGPSKTCQQCGHRRCRDCHRNPAKRVRELLHEARQQQQEQTQHAQTEQQESSEAMPMVMRTDDTTYAATEPASVQAQPGRSIDLEAADQEAASLGEQHQYVVQHRPCSGLQLLLRPRAQLVRRKCHECQTHFEPANQRKCQVCSHIRCEVCPCENMTGEALEDERHSATQPRMVATVQRVYKKPRQRVRWTCDQCQTLFVDRDRCRECGHRRCEECIRDPPKRIPRPPDPELLQSVEDKLSLANVPSSSTHPIGSVAT